MVRSRASRLPMPRSCSMMDSMIWFPIVCTGLKQVIGSWKIIAATLPRIARISLPVGFRPAKSTGAPPSFG
jgi:hypothetical protein